MPVCFFIPNKVDTLDNQRNHNTLFSEQCIHLVLQSVHAIQKLQQIKILV